MIKKYLEKFRIPGFRNPKSVVSVVRLSGIIADRSSFGRPGLSASGLVNVLENAFSISNLKAVALCINSPGGSPVQSSLIGKRIRTLANEKNIPVIAFTEDVAASGGYWLACAADEIYANESSIIGSIGVISSGFGFQDAIKKLGVERRIHTAGDMKSTLDPFVPEKPEDVERLLELQKDIFEIFTDMVKDRRKGKLKAPESELFSGAFWTGSRALQLGLIDGLGELTDVMQQRFGHDVKFKPVEPQQSWLKQKLGISSSSSKFKSNENMIFSTINNVLLSIEERSYWSKFGL